MLRKLGDLLPVLLLAALILSPPGPASAATSPQASEPTAGDVTIEIGSTYSFGPTPVGASVSRSFRLVNKDKTRRMRIYGLWVGQDPNHPEFAILEKPNDDAWLPPEETVRLTISFIALKPGKHKAHISWYVEMKPVSEEDKDNFFVFNVTGEALENPSGEK